MATSLSSSKPSLGHMLPASWTSVITEWLREDVPSLDYAAYVVGDRPNVARLLGKSPGVLAGRPFVDEIFRQLNCSVTWFVEEGESFEPVKVIAEVRGEARQLLQGERVALNLIARASGIATRARAFAEVKRKHGWHGVVAGTRKTTPGFRLVEKYAMLVGGLDAHRMDLSSMIMLKDNHIWSCGSITNAVHAAKAVGGFALKIEVEARTLEEAMEAAKAGADIVMLDNMTPATLRPAAASLKAAFPHVLIEGSGGVLLDNVHEYFDPNVDILSTGSATQSVPHVDFSLKIVRQ